jgi:hypothetical protein
VYPIASPISSMMLPENRREIAESAEEPEENKNEFKKSIFFEQPITRKKVKTENYLVFEYPYPADSLRCKC